MRIYRSIQIVFLGRAILSFFGFLGILEYFAARPDYLHGAPLRTFPFQYHGKVIFLDAKTTGIVTTLECIAVLSIVSFILSGFLKRDFRSKYLRSRKKGGSNDSN